MPPQRTIPPTKAVKTERTHEENQERAYIAASRRSDRSLEARIESARRASEIHKKRTGRALRVTEQDVINEEMYSEEDEEYPAAYRGLTQHLRAGSSDWNRRLNAYLTNHVAMRSALDQALMQSYSNRPGVPYSANSMYTPGFMPQQHPQLMQQSQMMQHPQLMQHSQMMHSAHMMHSAGVSSPQIQASHVSLRQQPYPRHHGRSMSMHIPHQQQGIQLSQYQQDNVNSRRSSIAVPTISPPLPLPIREQTSPQSNSAQMSSPRTNPTQMNPAQLSPPQMAAQQLQDSMVQPTFEQTASSAAPQTSYLSRNDDFYLDFPLTTQLPPETQQFLQPALDPTDPLYGSLMGGSYSSTGFGFDNGAVDLKSTIPDTSPGFHQFDFSDVCAGSLSQFPLCGSPPQGNFGSSYFPADPAGTVILSTPLKQTPVSRQNSGENLGLGTPSEEWYSFFNIDGVPETS